jgi:hypothetical protein
MTTFLSRRAALLAAGAGAITMLSACTSDIRPLADSSASGEASTSAGPSESASASASAGGSSEKSYLGPVKFDNYEKKGEYIPADETHKAQNVPKPLPPSNMHEKTIDGAYSAFSFWLASVNYLVLTGDNEPLKEADPSGRDVTAFKDYVSFYESNEGWFYGSEHALQVEMMTPQPVKAEGSEPLYYWRITLSKDPKAMMHVEGKGNRPMYQNTSMEPELSDLKLSYQDGKWFTYPTKVRGQGTASPSAKASDKANSDNF